jgi:ArsR family transcriptional regulator
MSELIKYVANFLKILSDPKRLEILILLKNGEKSSAEIQDAVEKPQPTVSQHLKILKNENLVAVVKKQNIKYYKIKDAYLFRILSSIQSYLLNLNQEKLKSLMDMSLFDTLL